MLDSGSLSDIETHALAEGGAGAPRGPAPAVLRVPVGETVVTALLDGTIDLPLSWFPCIDEAEAAPLLEREFARAPLPAALNAFLVQRGGRNVLIDTGAAEGMGPRLGRLPAALAASGVDPASVETVALTHLHPDHANGLVGPDGRPAFPRAEVVLHAAEHAYWHDDGARARAPDFVQPFFDAARAALAPYAGRIRLIGRAEEEVLPGLTAILLPGHTPGHTGYLVASGGESLLVWGDIVHAPLLQFARTDCGFALDVDLNQAIATRRRAMAMAADDRMTVAGMHLDFPGIGHVRRGAGSAEFKFVPLRWQAAF